MAIAHVCMGCGWDLARVRPSLEPHYSLALIICPRCRKPTTRVRHPLWIAFRKFRRLDFTITVLGLQITMAILLTIFTPLASLGMVVGLSGAQRGAIDSEIWWYYFWPFGVVGPITGAWLTAGFPHLIRWRVFLGWYAFICAVTFIGWFLAAMGDGISGRFMPMGVNPDGWPMLGLALVGYLAHVTMMGAVVVSAIAGIPLGWGIQRLMQSIRISLLRWRRRRLRLRSSA